MGADRQAQQHSAGRVGLNSLLNRFKNIQRFKRIQNSSKFWVIQKLPSLAPKNENKIWLERV
jgi:hypothetical protein